MLQLKIEDTMLFDEATEMRTMIKGQTLTLEHSLVSVSKWESKWKKPFLTREGHTRDETIDYIRYMTITQNVNPILYTLITDEQIAIVLNYMNDPMTATTISKQEGKGGMVKPTTSEEIYYAMAAYQIPFTCEKWHLNRLLMLIRVADERNKQPKKIGRGDLARRTRSLNAARRAKHHSRG